jgi:cation transport regulator ChaC
MVEPQVWVFFYGSYINFAVLKEVNYLPQHYEVARLPGFDIVIQPLANLIRSEEHTVYGLLATATHQELARLYAHAQTVLGGTYLPEAVLVQTLAGRWQPALCYLAPSQEPKPATAEYVERIAQPARVHGFPAWYVQRIESFRPS